MNLEGWLFDYKLINQTKDDNYIFGIFGINGKMVLQMYNILIDHNIYPHNIKHILGYDLELGFLSNYSYAYFDNDINIFFWLNYNDTYNFKSGYSKEGNLKK